MNQSPIIVVPSQSQYLLCNPVGYRCGPPPAPERPFVSDLSYILLLFYCLFQNCFY
jgi:hypothetical protein